MQHNRPFNNDIGIGIAQVNLKAAPNTDDSKVFHRYVS
jgi:hypothetical protein